MRVLQQLLRLAVLASVFAPALAPAKVFLTTDEALKLAFPGCQIQRGTVYLTQEQLEQASKLAEKPVTQALVNPYAATCEGKPAGTAYFDVHRVRTLPETLMVVVTPDGNVRRIEVLAFNEPEEYLPRAAWYQQFVGKRLNGELALKQAIRPIAGATLTARATAEAVRRILAIHSVINSPASVQK